MDVIGMNEVIVAWLVILERGLTLDAVLSTDIVSCVATRRRLPKRLRFFNPRARTRVPLLQRHARVFPTAST